MPKEVPWRKVKHHWEIYLFIFPVLAMVGLFLYYPAATGIFYSFYRWNGFDISEFNFITYDVTLLEPGAGLFGLLRNRSFWASMDIGGNYLDLVRNPDFWNSFRVAFILGAWNVLKMLPALLVAVCIHRCRSPRWQFFYRIAFVVPMVIPGLVVVLIWRSFFFDPNNGYLNRFLFSTGLIDLLSWVDVNIGLGGAFVPDPVTGLVATPSWLGDPRLILAACILWGFPWVLSFAVLTHLAKLGGIGRHIYEAAEIDGVGWWSKFRHIELPLITGSIYVLLVFVIIETIRDAGMVIALAGMEGGPGGAVTVPALFMLRKAFVEQRMGYACAVGIVLTLCVMSLQKITSTWMQWDELTPRQRRRFRVSVLCGAALLGYFYFSANLSGVFFVLAAILLYIGIPSRATILAICAAAGWEFRDSMFMTVLASVLFLAMVPWQALLNRLRIPFNPAASIVSAIERRRERRYRAVEGRVGIRPPTSWERFGEHAARGMKHATIWAVLALAFLPVYLMGIVSLKNNTQFYRSPAVLTRPFHWENWSVAWESVAPSVANSVYISTLGTLFVLFLALCGAYFFQRLKMPLSGVFWNAILLLMMMPTIANLVPTFRLLATMNLLNTLTALILVSASAGQIAAIFVLRNFVNDIPQDLFEAAEIDGASHFRQLITVVVPLSGPILGTVGVMQFVVIWNDFVMPLIVMRDQAKLPIMVQLLRMNGEYIKLWGPLMAGYAFASIPVVILFAFSMRLFVRGLTEGAIKD